MPDEFQHKPPPARPDEAAPAPWHDLYWRAWDALRYDRQFGAFGGEMPVTYAALSQYAHDHDIVGSDFELFRILFGAIDSEWLSYIQEQRRTKGGETS